MNNFLEKFDKEFDEKFDFTFVSPNGYREIRKELKDFFHSQIRKLQEEVKNCVPSEVGHGSYHCGSEECCDKETEEMRINEKLKDAECKGFNSCREQMKNNLEKLFEKEITI